MSFTRLCPQCSVSRKPNAFVVTRFVNGGSLLLRRAEGRMAMKRERELEPEGTTSMRRECDRLFKARHRALESESEALLRKEHD